MYFTYMCAEQNNILNEIFRYTISLFFWNRLMSCQDRIACRLIRLDNIKVYFGYPDNKYETQDMFFIVAISVLPLELILCACLVIFTSPYHSLRSKFKKLVKMVIMDREKILCSILLFFSRSQKKKKGILHKRDERNKRICS